MRQKCCCWTWAWAASVISIIALFGREAEGSSDFFSGLVVVAYWGTWLLACYTTGGTAAYCCAGAITQVCIRKYSTSADGLGDGTNDGNPGDVDGSHLELCEKGIGMWLSSEG